MNIRQALSCLVVPSGLVLVLSVVVWNWTPRPQVLRTFLPIWPYIVLAAALLLGWRYRRSRLLLILALITLIQPQFMHWLAPEFRSFALTAISVLLPLNLLWISFAAERHLLSLATLLRLVIIVAQGGVIWLAYHFYAAQSWAILHFNPVPARWWSLLPPHWLAQLVPLSIVLFAGAIFCLLVALCWRPMVERGALVLMVVSIFVAQRSTGEVALFYTATAILILLVALLETSHSMAFRDELTGLGSRRSMNDYLQRLAGNYTLTMVDIDHFKRVNDTYGHDIGDQVLKMVASCLTKVRGGGKVFRYGGEEFILVFAGKQREQVLPHVEALRMAIERANFTLRSKTRAQKKPTTRTRMSTKSRQLNVTVSMGVAEHSERKQTTDQVIKLADNALYRAKHGGRNRIC
ncbi:MAG: GGDEF domain-containing protein [Desulfuromonas sp.]|nr:GGDEF domain-containing protein [Desulfuromonas sp.]